MPLYEYKCDLCGDVFEKIERFSDPPLTQHDGCGGKVERLISRSALHFKGSGWYVTDYAKKQNGAGDTGSEKGDKTEKPAKAESGDAAKSGDSKKGGDSKKSGDTKSESGSSSTPASASTSTKTEKK
jgi:putative FmdB family regulatory protein